MCSGRMRKNGNGSSFQGSRFLELVRSAKRRPNSHSFTINTGFAGHQIVYDWGTKPHSIPTPQRNRCHPRWNRRWRHTTNESAQMSCITSLLEGACTEIESQLRPRLSGNQRFLIAGFLPQVWVFETEDQVVSIVVDRQGNAFTQALNRGNRDVTFRWKNEYLASVLIRKSAVYVPQGEHPTITFHTQKGRAAFELLSPRLGLQYQPTRESSLAEQGNGERNFR